MGRCCGSVALDLDLLKPQRVLASADAQDQQAPKVWLENAYRKHHPVLQWLPTKLAEWIGEICKMTFGYLTRPIPGGWTGKQRLQGKHVAVAIWLREGASRRTFRY